jgi:hypothetical protein
MKKGLLLTFLCVVALSAQEEQEEYVTYETPGVDPTDYVLIAYPLTEEELTAFSTDDGKVSEFWSNDKWAERDWIDMNTEQNSFPGRDEWDGPNDAAIKIQVGASSTGLHLYFEVTDDIFVDPIVDIGTELGGGGSSWQYDAVDIYFDYMSSEQVLSRSEMESARPNAPWDLTITSQQFQCWMGATEIPDQFRFNYYDVVFWDWSYKYYSFEEAETNLNGMGMEAIIVDETHKAQEWFLPWAQLGTGGVEGLLDGRRFAFTGGYNDIDGDGKFVNSLRWKNLDPFKDASQIALEGLFFETTWGDLHMADGIGPSDSEREDIGVKDPRVNYNAPRGNVKSVDYFTLQGKKLPMEAAERMLKRSNVTLVRRETLHDGTSRSSIAPRLTK